MQFLRQWLSPVQRAQFAKKGYFEVVGSDTGQRYRIYAGAATNVCEVDENGHLTLGLCFLRMGELPIGDVMLSQKIALESPRAARSQWPENSFRMARFGEVGFFAKASRNQSAIGRSGEHGAAILTLDCGNSARAANIKRPDAM